MKLRKTILSTKELKHQTPKSHKQILNPQDQMPDCAGEYRDEEDNKEEDLRPLPRELEVTIIGLEEWPQNIVTIKRVDRYKIKNHEREINDH